MIVVCQQMTHLFEQVGCLLLLVLVGCCLRLMMNDDE